MGDVFLLDTERRVSQSVGEISIIGEQQETFCIHVKAAYGKHARFLRNKFKNSRTAVRIVGGSDHANRLIHQEMHKPWSDPDDDAVDCNHIVIGIDTTAQHRYLTINSDGTFGDQVLTDPSASDSYTSENLLQTLPHSILVVHPFPSPSSKSPNEGRTL